MAVSLTKGMRKAQHLMRGALSKTKSTSYKEEKPKFSNTFIFRSNLNKVYMEARTLLEPHEYDSFLSWSDSQIDAIFPMHKSEPIEFDYLSGVTSARDIEFTKEIKWVVSRLKQEHNTLNQHCIFSRKIGEEFLANDNFEALKCLDESTTLLGESMWSIQTRIGLIHYFHGLEAQKEYYYLLRGKYRRGLLAFVAYQTSVRNEDPTNIRKYREDVRALLQTRYKTQSNYLNYRLTGLWPADLQKVGEIFKTEQSNSVIDLYETFVSYCQHVSTSNNVAKLQDMVVQHCEELSDICDFRLEKILFRLGATRSLKGKDVRSELYLEKVASGDIRGLYSQLLRSDSGSDPWEQIYKAIVLSTKVFIPNKTEVRVNDVVMKLVHSLNRSAEILSEPQIFEKIGLNFRGLASVQALCDFNKELHVVNFDNFYDFSKVGLNCEKYGLEDFNCDHGVISEVISHTSGDLSKRLMSYPSVDKVRSGTYVVDSILNVVHLIKQAKFDDAFDQLLSLKSRSTSRSMNVILSSLINQCVIAKGDRELIINQVSKSVVQDEGYVFFTPVEEAVGHYEYSEFKKLEPKLEPLIALYSLWRSTGEDKNLSHVRFGLRKFLKNKGKIPPSEIFANKASLSQEEIFFLKFICVPNILDSSNVFLNSRDLLVERQNVLLILNEHDVENSDLYTDKILEITYRLKIEDGVKLVDRNRINVDEKAIVSWAKRELQSDFARYKNLVSAGIGDEKNFDEVIQELNLASRSGKGVFFTPSSEADFELINLLNSLRREFLTNPEAGLDAFLSKRIRHQSFLGMIRGPLEFENLITARSSIHGPYKENIYWINKFDGFSQVQIDQMSVAFRTFSERFDALLSDVRDEKLHLYSDETKQGMFKIELNAPVLLLVRSVANMDLEIEDFCKTAFSVFWPVLFLGLDAVREYISQELKMHIADEFSELHSNLKLVAGDHKEFPQLSLKLNKARSEVQAALTEVEGWFGTPDRNKMSQVFELREAADIAIHAFQKIHRAFQPQIDLTVNGEASLNSGSVILLSEILFICFDNVKHRSGLKKPIVKIVISVDAAEGLINILFENEVVSGVRTPDLDKALAKRKQDIDEKNFGKKVRGEGGTGFFKIGSAVHQSNKGSLDFGFSTDRKFEVKIALSYISMIPAETN